MRNWHHPPGTFPRWKGNCCLCLAHNRHDIIFLSFSPVSGSTQRLLPGRKVSLQPLHPLSGTARLLALALSSLSSQRGPKLPSHLVPAHLSHPFQDQIKLPSGREALGGLEPSTKGSKEELKRMAKFTQVSSEKQNQTSEFCLTNHQPRFIFNLPFPSLEGGPRDPHKPDSALASGHRVSNFERGLLQNVQFQALVRLPTSCPSFLGEWDLFKRGIKSPCPCHWVKTCSVPGNFKD